MRMNDNKRFLLPFYPLLIVSNLARSRTRHRLDASTADALQVERPRYFLVEEDVLHDEEVAFRRGTGFEVVDWRYEE